MSPRSIGLNEQLHAYLLRWGTREHDELRAIRDETAGMPGSHMMLAPEEAQLMMMLARLSGARRYLEIGTFTGYSTLAMALALPFDGSVVACELERRFIEIARPHWERAGVADLIDVRIGPAIETLASLHADPFDIAFIDADKENLLAYYERVLSLIRPGGLVLIDNTLWNGSVADEGNGTPATRAVRELNRRVHDDVRVEVVLVPVGDGLTIARKAA